MSFQTEILRHYGGFDSRLGLQGGEQLLSEEKELMDKIRADGHTVYYHPQAVVWHLVGEKRQTVEYVIRRYHGYGKTRAFVRFLYDWPGRRRVAKRLLGHMLDYRELLKNVLWKLVLRRT